LLICLPLVVELTSFSCTVWHAANITGSRSDVVIADEVANLTTAGRPIPSIVALYIDVSATFYLSGDYVASANPARGLAAMGTTRGYRSGNQK